MTRILAIKKAKDMATLFILNIFALYVKMNTIAGIHVPDKRTGCAPNYYHCMGTVQGEVHWKSIESNLRTLSS